MNYLPMEYMQEYKIMNEYNNILNHNTSGILVIPSHKSCKVWLGILFVRSGYYENGVFHFTINLPDNFPTDEVPKVYFSPLICHPLIDRNSGQLDISIRLHKWDINNENGTHMWHINQAIRDAFYNFELVEKDDTEEETYYAFQSIGQIRNQEALHLLRNDHESFYQITREVVQKLHPSNSKNDIIPDIHRIELTGWDDNEFMEKVKDKFISDPKGTNNQYQGKSACGFSWLDPDTMRIFASN